MNTNKRVMIIDDDVTILEVIKDSLEHEQLDISVFDDPNDALNEIKRSDYDLFLIDLKLPYINGISLLKMIRQSQKDARYIIMTAYGGTPCVIDAFKAGVSDFILKPFDIENVAFLIKKQLEEKDKFETSLQKLSNMIESRDMFELEGFLNKLNRSSCDDLKCCDSKLNELSMQYNKLAKENIKDRIKISGKSKKEKKSSADTLSYIMHEIRSPLHSVVGYTRKLLKEYELGETGNICEYLSDILTSSLYVLDVTQNILFSSALESDKLNLNLEAININDLLRRIESMLLSKIKAKNLIYNKKIKCCSPYIIADRMKLTQILYNLLDNAIKFTYCGAISLEVKDSDDKKSISFAIKDTGSGIRLKDRPKLFKKFERLNASSEEGAGLGLNITKRLVDLHGGDLWVESKYKRGSTFYFTIPFHFEERASSQMTA